jgi:sugar-specific transcriptional regulator TrmB/DNA-binding CsgD family transcriptional regulator
MLEALNLTGDEEAVYLALLELTTVPAGRLAEVDGVQDVASALASLEARGLVAGSPDADDGYRVAEPQAAVREALRDAEQTLAAAKASVSALSQRFARGHSAVASLSEVECVDGRQALARVAWWREHARKELRVIDPTGVEDGPDPVDRLPRIDEGVAVREIYGRAVVDRPDSFEAVKWRLAHGGRARTLTSAPVKLTLVDSTAAILPARSGNQYRDGIVVVRQTSLLDALVDYFEVLWSIAQPLDAYRPASPGALDADDRTLLSLMAAGFSDETIGRRLGVSEGDTESRLARAIERLGAENPFQAGVQAARSGMF